MRAYFDKLLSSSQQQKTLPLIYPVLIALFAGAIFSLALAPYHYWWLAILSPALLYAGLWHWLGLRDWLVVCRRILAVHLDSCLWRYQCISQCRDDPDYGTGDGSV